MELITAPVNLPPSMTGKVVIAATPIFRYVNAEENSDKWWQAQIEAVAQATGQYIVIVRYGRRGAIGQSQIKNFDSGREASDFVHLKMAEKQRKGYSHLDPRLTVGEQQESLTDQTLDPQVTPSPPKPNIKRSPKKKTEPAGRRIILD